MVSPISSIYYFQSPVNFNCPIPQTSTVTMNMFTAVPEFNGLSTEVKVPPC